MDKIVKLSEHYNFTLYLNKNKSSAKNCGALAFGIDRNQESFFRKTKTPADAMKAVVYCKNLFDFFSFG